MTTVWLALRADVRRRWPALLSLAVLLGLIGGVVLTAATGARRTDTAYPRLLSWANASQVDIVPENTGFTGYYRALAPLPHIAAMTTVSIYNVVLLPRNPGLVNLMSSPDGAMGVSVDRVKILAGRLYDPKAPGQAMVDQQHASTEHLTPGSTLRLYGVPSAPSGAPEYSKAVTLTFRVTGIVVFDDEIVPTGSNNTLPTALVSSPFTATTAAANLSAGDEAAIRLQPGASQAAFTSAAETLARRYAGTTPTGLGTGAVLPAIVLSAGARESTTDSPGVRRRRRDLALLKTLGFTRRQVLGTVAWEAGAFAAVALLIGLPLGVIAGRWAWAVFASAAGVSTAATVPLATVLLAIPATLLAATLIAAAPGREAARLRPALVLRTE
jgi:putative ABC transport system permease protein